MWRSPAAPFSVPVGAVPSTAEAYEVALAKCVAAERARRLLARKEEAFVKSLRKGMARHAHASLPQAGGVEELLEGLAHKSQPHFLDDFTVFDTETTGLSAEKDRLLEVAAVRYTGWQEVARMQSFVRFTGRMPHFITSLTGIREADVRQAPDSKVVLKEFRQLAGESLLVGHNVGFDVRMIEAERTRLGAVTPLPNQSLCTMLLARQRTPAPHKLGVLCARFGIPVVGAHRALNDVLMTYALLQHMHQQDPFTALAPLKPAGKVPATTLGLFAAA